MPAAERRLVRDAFCRLVTSDGTRAQIERGELVHLLGEEVEAEAVLERLVAARLLSCQRSETGALVLEIVHEALLGAWPRLVSWLREDAEGSRLRDQLNAAARQWHERGRPSGLLWREGALVELKLWRSRHRTALTSVEEAFAMASVVTEARGARLRLGLVVAAFMILAAGAVGLVHLRALAEANAKTAHARLAASHQEQGRQALVSGDPLHGAVYLTAAWREGQRNPAIRFLLGRTLRRLDRQLTTLRGHRGIVYAAAFDARGERLVTAGDDGVGRLWDGAGRPVAELRGHEAAIVGAAFSRDGTQIATASWDGTARLWDAQSGQRLATLRLGYGRVWSAVFSPDQSRVLVAGWTGMRMWDAKTRQPLFDLVGHAGEVRAAAFAPDGARIASAGSDGTVRIWDAHTGRLLQILRGHGGPVRSVSFDASGSVLVSAAQDGTARVWKPGSDRGMAVLRGPGGALMDAKVDTRSKRVVTAGLDGVRLWSLADGKLLETLGGHEGNVPWASFSTGGERIVTAGFDGSARIWDAQSGLPLVALFGHTSSVMQASFSPDGTRVLTAGYDGTARLWRVDRAELDVRIADGHPLWSARLAAREQVLFTAAEDGSVAKWDAQTGELLLRIPRHGGFA